jgi:hypothetical protein
VVVLCRMLQEKFSREQSSGAGVLKILISPEKRTRALKVFKKKFGPVISRANCISEP